MLRGGTFGIFDARRQLLPIPRPSRERIERGSSTNLLISDARFRKQCNANWQHMHPVECIKVKCHLRIITLAEKTWCKFTLRANKSVFLHGDNPIAALALKLSPLPRSQSNQDALSVS